MTLQRHLAKIARDLREGIATDMPRQRMDYAARQLETLSGIPLPDIESVADAGGTLLLIHTRVPCSMEQVRGLQLFLTGVAR